MEGIVLMNNVIIGVSSMRMIVSANKGRLSVRIPVIHVLI
jgi:hypothetical protein